MLFARRADSKLWGFPSGELRAGESTVDAACRIGTGQILVDVARSAVRLVHVHRRADTPDAAAGLFVRASRFRGIPLAADPRQVDQLAWAPPAAVPEPSEPGVADAAAISGVAARRRPCRAGPRQPDTATAAVPGRTPRPGSGMAMVTVEGHTGWGTRTEPPSTQAIAARVARDPALGAGDSGTGAAREVTTFVGRTDNGVEVSVGVRPEPGAGQAAVLLDLGTPPQETSARVRLGPDEAHRLAAALAAAACAAVAAPRGMRPR